MEILRPYGVQSDFYFPLIKASVQDFAVSADYTFVAGDAKISKNGGAAASTTNSPTAITMGNGAIWKLTLTATEMQAALIVVTFVDAATKAIEDQAILIATYGNASAQYLFDLGVATQSVAVASIAANAITATAIATDAITAAKIAADAIGASELAADAVTEIATGILDAAIAEPSGIFTWPTSIRNALGWLGALSRNKMTQTATTSTLRNDADSATLSTSTIANDGTTFTRGEWS